MPVAYKKLEQIIDKATLGIMFLETGRCIKYENPQLVFPCTFTCEIVTWASEDERWMSRKVNFFDSVDVLLLIQPSDVRDAIYNILLLTNPTLNK